MDPAWMRLLQILRDREGTGTGEGGDPARHTPPPARRAAAREDEDDDDIDDEHDGQIKALRREAKKRRLEAKQLREELDAVKSNQAKAIEDAIAAAVEKVTKEANTKAQELADKAASDAKKAADERLTRTSLKEALKAAGVIDEETGLKLIDASGIKVNDAGDVDGVAEAITKLKEGKSFLFSQPGTTTTQTGVKPPQATAPQVRDVRTLSDDEYKAELGKLGIKR